MGNKGETMKY